MAKKQRKCAYCKNPFWTSMIKVFVFKERKCPKKKCGGKLFVYNDKGYTQCKKCRLKIKLNDDAQLGKTSVRLRGTSKDFRIANQMSRAGIEVDKRVVPKERYCQRCRNLRTVMNNALKSRRLKRGTQELPIEDAQRLLRAQVLQKIRTQQQETKELENRIRESKKKLAEYNAKKKEKSVKPKKIRQGKSEPAMCMTPFNTVSPNKKGKPKKREK